MTHKQAIYNYFENYIRGFNELIILANVIDSRALYIFDKIANSKFKLSYQSFNSDIFKNNNLAAWAEDLFYIYEAYFELKDYLDI